MKFFKLMTALFFLFFISDFALANQTYNIEQLNNMPVEAFIKSLSPVFENNTWPAEQAASLRPFKGFVDMYMALVSVIEKAGSDQQIRLIKSHPELVCKNLRSSHLPPFSVIEQASAGLSECSEKEASELEKLNKDYYKKFGFPFLLAVKNAAKQQIFSSMTSRMKNNRKMELDVALQQQYKIALLRLLDKVKEEKSVN
ncbi:2-oxo-4-hydroxy-4-carboxy-5-ureidoimidazoline decarboxylase [Enterobacteriaceae bacterium LUAb1]